MLGRPDHPPPYYSFLFLVSFCQSLSSSENEYYAMTETATELMYMKQLFKFLEVPIELLMIIKADHQRATPIFLARNETSSRTKHVNMRDHFIQELADRWIIKLEYVSYQGEYNWCAHKKFTKWAIWERLLLSLFSEWATEEFCIMSYVNTPSVH